MSRFKVEIIDTETKERYRIDDILKYMNKVEHFCCKKPMYACGGIIGESTTFYRCDICKREISVLDKH